MSHLHRGSAIYAGLGGNQIATISVDGSLSLSFSIHDTTDDFMLNVSNGHAWVDIELTIDDAEQVAQWLVETIAERRSPSGQAFKNEAIRRSAERAAVDKT